MPNTATFSHNNQEETGFQRATLTLNVQNSTWESSEGWGIRKRERKAEGITTSSTFTKNGENDENFVFTVTKYERHARPNTLKPDGTGRTFSRPASEARADAGATMKSFFMEGEMNRE